MLQQEPTEERRAAADEALGMFVAAAEKTVDGIYMGEEVRTYVLRGIFNIAMDHALVKFPADVLQLLAFG